MTSLEPNLDWTEHYVKYGFAVAKGLVDRDFCREAVKRASHYVGHELPPNEWTTENTSVLHTPFFEGGNEPDPVFERVIEQPKLRAAIERMYGGPGHWNEEKNYYLFIKPFNPKAQPSLAKRGHIDFPNQAIPALYRGFTFQVLLADNEPFSGNLTLYPGTHHVLQKRLFEDERLSTKSGQFDDVAMPEPFEFVGEAGDVCFMHHLVFHSGNESHAANRSPRVALHVEAFRDAWLPEIDPSRPGLSPWLRSLAANGPFRPDPATEAAHMKKRRDYVEELRNKATAPASRY
jgi:hypothetical protein